MIEHSVDYLRHKLIEESLMVAFVSILFLLHVRSALVAIVTLPLGILGAFVIMQAQRVKDANIMSLGELPLPSGRWSMHQLLWLKMFTGNYQSLKMVSVQGATAGYDIGDERSRPEFILFIIDYHNFFLPVFALTGQSEKLFSPLAFTKTYSMAVASFLSVTLVPVLVVLLVRGKIKPENVNPVNRFFLALYRPVLDFCVAA